MFVWRQQSIFISCWFKPNSSLVHYKRTVVVIRMALLAWSYCSSVLLPVWDLFLHQSYAKGWMRTPEYCLQWDSTARCWDKHDASHTWMDSLTLRLRVCLISFLNWGPVYGTFAGMNRVRQLKPLMLGWNLPFGHRSPASRKCLTGLFRRKEEALQYSRDPKEGWPCWVAVFFCLCNVPARLLLYYR